MALPDFDKPAQIGKRMNCSNFPDNNKSCNKTSLFFFTVQLTRNMVDDGKGKKINTYPKKRVWEGVIEKKKKKTREHTKKSRNEM